MTFRITDLDYGTINNNHNNEYLDKLEHLTCTGPLEVLTQTLQAFTYCQNSTHTT